MGETGKRSRRDDGDSKNQKRRTDRDEKGSDDELIVYRILCPNNVIGSVIGKNGKVINSIRAETKAKVKVVDPFPGAKDRVITIYCYVKEKEDVEIDEDFNEKTPLCTAQDALLKVYTVIANALAANGDSDKKRKDKEECQLLVPSSQSANIIGKSGTTIKKLRSKMRANIKVVAREASDPTHSCALEFDNFVLITGDPESVRRSLFAVSAIMYKFTPKEDIPLTTNVPEVRPSIIIPSDVPIYQPAGIYPSVDPIMPSRSVQSVLGTTHIPELPGYVDAGSTWPIYSSALPMVSGYGGASQTEELTIRVLCPTNNIGRVIGKGGASIKSVRQASGARIEVCDAKADRDQCIITVISTESVDDLKSMAVEAVLLLQGKINDEDEDTVTFRLLVPSKVIGCIIGKGGSIVNEIRKRTRADVRISKGEKPKCADSNDELVEVSGEVSSVRDALIQIVLRLRDDVVKGREGNHNPSAGADSLRSSGKESAFGFALAPGLPNVPPPAPLSYEHRIETGNGVGMRSSGSHYGRHESLSMADDGYGSYSSYSSKLYGGRLPPPSALEIVIPGIAVGKVMGKGGSNIDNIRKISGASVDIIDSKSSRGDQIAIISGTQEQKRAAENLIQAFIMST
ncbi:KH domain-containing protein At4g18375 isoform X1 [Lycium ferocissimum]|uniref:KH domain-containing protein At4g18375 isoform X1 n=1 Tax=Lycium ferocissimum TaxID=112874 RepID=UPI002815656D|nr:KH domain-containing protein At4g18375 isoform X1 [Lycium ferocissimum]XP_059303827.1 KH domain-containing protein At4g18375 isoform X1 [Lycium ferocissimum]